ncbi:MAG: twin-arginine translocation signal domain-containing protein [Acidobacteriota bacterium]|nr:twin-arginine translocation signal domain-containing protein [Acidobacteriota bacterium]
MTKEFEKSVEAVKLASRRQFVKTIAALAVAAPIVASAQTTTTKEATAPPNPQPTPAPQTISPVAKAYGEVAEARFGSKLTAEQLSSVKRDLEGNVRTADRLRTVKLLNADEPDFVFSA